MNARLLLSLIAVLALGYAGLAQKKYDKLVVKADAAYDGGHFDKATKYLAKLKKKATAKLGAQNNYMPGYYLRDAKFHLVSGILVGFDESLKNAEAAALAAYGEGSEGLASTYLEIARIYNLYGNFRLSHAYCDKAEGLPGTSNNEPLMAQFALVKAEALTGQGFWNQAIALLRSKENYFIGRATDKETKAVDGKLQSVRLDEQEVILRFNQYAKFQTVLATAYSKKGAYNSADSTFVIAQGWIGRNLRYMGATSLALVEMNYNWRIALNEQGLKNLENRKLRDLQFDYMLNDVKRQTIPVTPLAQEIYLHLLEELQEQGARGRYSVVKAEYSKSLDKYFGRTSLVRLNMDAVEFSAKFNRDQTNNLETKALNLVNSPSLPHNYKTTIKLYEFLYDVAISKQRYANAESYMNELLAIKKDLYGETSPEYHLARVRLACFYLDYTNKLKEASTIFEESYTNLLSREIGDWHKDHLTILSHMARLYEYGDKYTQAVAVSKKASEVALKYSKQDPDYAIALDEIAQLQIKLGQYEEADKGIKDALAILETFRKDDSYSGPYVHALQTEARLFGIKGMFDEAESNLNRSGKIIRRVGVPPGSELSTAGEMSALYIQLGKYSSTEKLLDLLIPNYQKTYGSNSFRLIEPLVNQGRIQLAKGDYTEAEHTAISASDIATSVYGATSTKLAPVQRLLSDIYYTLGDYEKAQAQIQAAIQSQQKQFGRAHIDVARSISQLALIKFHKGDSKEEVERLMVEARDIIAGKLGTDNPTYADALKNLAVLNISKKDYTQAFSSLTQAEAIWRARTGSKNNINAAAIYTLTGDVYYEIRNYPKAQEFYNRSKGLYEQYFSKTHPEYVRVLSKLSKVYYMEKDYKQSKKLIEESLLNYENFIKNYFPALSEREKAKYWNTIRPDFEFYNTLAFGNLEDFRDVTSKVYDYQLMTKALLLNSSIKIRERILSSDDEELRAQFSLWLIQKEMLTAALSMSTTQLAENEIDPGALQAEVEQLEKYLSEKSELFGQSFEDRRITYTDVQKSLKPNELAVEMVRYRYFDHVFTDSVVYAVLYVANDRAKPKSIILGDGTRMESRFFRYYRNAIISKIPDRISYGVFWEPIQKELGRASTIYLSADGVYNQINLEAIPTPDDKYVIDNFNIVLVSNTRDLFLRSVKQRREAEYNTASMFGNPTFYLTASTDRTVSALPGTEKEVTQVESMLKQKGWITSEFVEQSATEENIKELNSPKIFHIATHGFYKPAQDTAPQAEIEGDEATLAQNPLLRTGLLLRGAGDLLAKTDYNYNLENGILTAYEAMNLNLDRTDLVVLSACETGLGEIEAGEGVYGLQRAFLVAGAKTLIMSMFKVDDAATQKLMLNFYQKWLNTGNLRQSFIDAKKEIRVEYPEPIFWGAFMMIGLD